MKTRPTCNGHGQVYQTDAKLDGGVFSLDDKKNIALFGATMLQLCTCPRCHGAGEIEK